MAYIKKEFDEPIIQTELSSDINIYDKKEKPQTTLIDLNSDSATKQLLLEAKQKRIKNKKSSNVSSKKKKPIKKTKSEVELALIRYKLAFSTDSTSNQIAKLNRQYKDPTDKLLNKLYSRNKNENSLDNKYERKINNRLNVLQNENIQQMRALNLDRGNLFGNRSKRDVEIQTDTINRNSLLDEINSRSVGVEANIFDDEEGVEEEKEEEEIPIPAARATQVGAFDGLPDEDYPPPPPSINFNYLQLQSQDVVQAQSLDEVMNEELQNFGEFFYGYNDRYPDRRTTRNLVFPEDVRKAEQNIFNRFTQRERLLDEARLARNIQDSYVDEEIDISIQDESDILPSLTITYSGDEVDTDFEFDISDEEENIVFPLTTLTYPSDEEKFDDEEEDVMNLIKEKQDELTSLQNEMINIQQKLTKAESKGKSTEKLEKEEIFVLDKINSLGDEIEELLLKD